MCGKEKFIATYLQHGLESFIDNLCHHTKFAFRYSIVIYVKVA